MFSHTMKTRKYTKRGRRMKCKSRPSGEGFFGRGTLAFPPMPSMAQSIAVPMPKRPKCATITVRCGDEQLRFTARRFDAKTFMVRGKLRSAAWCGKVIAVALEGTL